MKNVIIIGILIILMSLSASALEINNFTNSLEIENLTFTDSINNITRYINLPTYSTSTYGSMNLLGFQVDRNLYNQSISYERYTSGYTINNEANTYDGSFSTYGRILASSGTKTAYLYENYTHTNTSGVTLHTKSHAQMTGVADIGFVNVTCYDSSSWLTVYYRDWTYFNDGSVNEEYNSIPAGCLLDNIQIRTHMFADENSAIAETRFYENQILYNNSKPSYIYLDVGTPDATREYTSISTIETSESVTDFSSKINSILPGCSCVGCNITGVYCNIPILFHSETAGLLEYSSINITYGLGASKLTVNLLDSDTKNKITNTNITVQSIGSAQQDESDTDTGQVNFSINFSTTSSSTHTIVSFDDQTNDYSTTIRNLSIQQGINTTLNVYMVNTSANSKEVTIVVEDEQRNKLEGAVIHIQQRDPATNTYLNLADLTTNPNGEANYKFKLNNVFYQFLVDYNDERVYTSSEPITISTNDDTIYLPALLIDPFIGYHDSVINANIDLDFTAVTNASGYFTTTYSGNTVIDICLNVYEYNATGPILNSTTCDSDTSGTINSPTLAPLNTTLYLSKVIIDINDGYGNRTVKTLSEYVGLDSGNNKIPDATIIVVMAIALSAFGFMAHPVAGLLMLVINFTFIFMSKLTYINAEPFILIISLAIFSIATIATRK